MDNDEVIEDITINEDQKVSSKTVEQMETENVHITKCEDIAITSNASTETVQLESNNVSSESSSIGDYLSSKSSTVEQGLEDQSIYASDDGISSTVNYLSENSNFSHSDPNYDNILDSSSMELESSQSIHCEEDSQMLTIHSEETSQLFNSICEKLSINDQDNIDTEDDPSQNSTFGEKAPPLSGSMEMEDTLDISNTVETSSGDHLYKTLIETSSKSSNCSKRSDEDPGNNGDFSWYDYLLHTGDEPVPATAFPHIEHSFTTGVENGQCAEMISDNEVVLNGDESTYWIVEVITAHDSLLRLKYVYIDSKSAPHFWCSLFDHRLRPLSRNRDLGMLQPPVSVSKTHSGNVSLVETMMDILPTLKSIPDEAFSEDSIKNYSRLSEGMVLEILAQSTPFSGWFAKVVKNVRGRLHLEYLSPNIESPSITFWLFYTNKRVKPVRWIRDSGPKYKYVPPAELLLNDLSANSGWIRDLCKKSPGATTWLPRSAEPTKHRIAIGHTFAYVNPHSDVIEVVSVTEIHNDCWFTVSCDAFTVVTSFDDWFLLPVCFCAPSAITAMSLEKSGPSASDTAAADPDTRMLQLCHRRRQASSDFGSGMKLEAVHPTNPELICAATITEVLCHLLRLKLDCDPGAAPFLRTVQSTDIFPIEWAVDAGHPFLYPKYKKMPVAPQVELEDENKVEERIAWCPPIYVNPWCVTGPLINKRKLARVPKSVGAGPLKLVLLRLLTFLFNSGYRPTKVLMEIDALLQKNRYWPKIHVKARYKQTIFQTSLTIPPYVYMVETFLTRVCVILECCPNLLTFTQSDEECLHGCPKKSCFYEKLSYPDDNKMFSDERPSKVRKILLCSDKQIERSPPLEDDDECMDLDRDESIESYSDYSDSSRPSSPFLETDCAPSSPVAELCPSTHPDDFRRHIQSLDPGGLGVWDVTTDPETWSVDTLCRYVATMPDIDHLAPLLKSECFDGSAFLLLDLPSILNDLHIPYPSGVKLAQLVFRLKMVRHIFTE